MTLGNFFILSSFHLASVGHISGPSFRRKKDPDLGMWAPHGLPPHHATLSPVPPLHPISKVVQIPSSLYSLEAELDEE
jgi:hypothetical protein